MGRHSEMETLVERLEASELARERTKVVLLTLGGQWSVKDGYERLGMKRTRFQDLRSRMLRAALYALEEGAAGRPRSAQAGRSRREIRLESRVCELKQEVRSVRAQLDIAESDVGAAVRARKLARSARRRL
jgi:hypothetical protein